MNAKTKQAIDWLIERGVDPTAAAGMILGTLVEPSTVTAAGPTAAPSGKPDDYVLHDVADLPCQHPTNPCKALLRSNGPRSRRHGNRGHRIVR